MFRFYINQEKWITLVDSIKGKPFEIFNGLANEEDHTKVGKGSCKNCQPTELIYQEGCLTCKGCGSSKCD